MTRPFNILSLGYDRTLIRLRSMVLRQAGYAVEEAYSIEQALARAKSDVIDLLLICHTIPASDQLKLINTVQRWRRWLPVVCVTNEEFACAVDDCVAVQNSPVELLEGARSAASMRPS